MKMTKKHAWVAFGVLMVILAGFLVGEYIAWSKDKKDKETTTTEEKEGEGEEKEKIKPDQIDTAALLIANGDGDVKVATLIKNPTSETSKAIKAEVDILRQEHAPQIADNKAAIEEVQKQVTDINTKLNQSGQATVALNNRVAAFENGSSVNIDHTFKLIQNIAKGVSQTTGDVNDAVDNTRKLWNNVTGTEEGGGEKSGSKLSAPNSTGPTPPGNPTSMTLPTLGNRTAILIVRGKPYFRQSVKGGRVTYCALKTKPQNGYRRIENTMASVDYRPYKPNEDQRWHLNPANSYRFPSARR